LIASGDVVRSILISLPIRAEILQGPMGNDRGIQSVTDFDRDTSYRVQTEREAAWTWTILRDSDLVSYSQNFVTMNL